MKKYYIHIFAIIVVIAIFSSDLGTKIDSLSPIIQGVVMLAFIIPTCHLLFLVGKDLNIKTGFRLVAKIVMFFLIFCYVGGLLAEFRQ